MRSISKNINLSSEMRESELTAPGVPFPPFLCTISTFKQLIGLNSTVATAAIKSQLLSWMLTEAPMAGDEDDRTRLGEKNRKKKRPRPLLFGVIRKQICTIGRELVSKVRHSSDRPYGAAGTALDSCPANAAADGTCTRRLGGTKLNINPIFFFLTRMAQRAAESPPAC